MTTPELQTLIEVLTKWFAGHGVTLLTIKIDGRSDRLYEAHGKLESALFDVDWDGADLKLDYMFELERRDERFRFTELIFDSNTEFKIKYAR